MNWYENPDRASWESILRRPAIRAEAIEPAVKNILDEVRTQGDAAIRKFSMIFDKIEIREIAVSAQAMADAESALDEDLKQAIRLAAAHIEKFHRAQDREEEIIETGPGIRCWRRAVPIEKIGLYIPGGTAPLFSTILMLGIPAKIAGCGEIILCSPPSHQGTLHPAILYAAKRAGIQKVFKVGGAQAIAAMAYGTATIPRVYKIFGPGNQYVTSAKQWVQRDGTAIDMPAGPSELAIFADATANPAWVAADLLSQAEHGEDSQVVLVCLDSRMGKAVEAAIRDQLESLPRKSIAEQALSHSRIIIVRDTGEALDLLNAYAPEHLILACGDAYALSGKIVNAGSVFIGSYSPESAGDYASGTNHVLPTNGYARSYSGVSLDSFLRKISFQELSPRGVKEIGAAVERMAMAEGLEGHARAMRLRMDSSETGNLTT